MSTPAPRLTLPREYYADPQHFVRERERFFGGMWVCACRSEDVLDPGAYVVREIAGESVILVRRRDGGVSGFYNVCRHRGTRLCTEAAGRVADRIQCAYHAWTYDLEGRLVSAPHMEDAPGFCREDNGLSPVAAAEWEGLVFASLAAQPEPLEQHVGALAPTFAPWGLRDLRRGYRTTYDVKANWKLLILNYSECLHCPVIHPGLQKLSHYMTGDNEPAADTWLGGRMTLREGVFTMSRDGRQRRQPLPGLSGDLLRHVYYYALLPNLLISAHPDYVMLHVLWPLACDRTEVACDWLFHPSELASPAFDPADVIDFWDETNRQDWHVSERSQLGIASRAYRPGHYSPREELLWQFDEIVRRRT